MTGFTWANAGGAGISMVTLSTVLGKVSGLSPHEAVLFLAEFNNTNRMIRGISGYATEKLEKAQKG